MVEVKRATEIAQALTELLGKDVPMMDVYDEMFLIEQGICGADKTFNAYVRQYMEGDMKPSLKKRIIKNKVSLFRST